MSLVNRYGRFAEAYFRYRQCITVLDPKDGNNTFLRNAGNYLTAKNTLDIHFSCRLRIKQSRHFFCSFKLRIRDLKLI
jgi:hypothetical protein